MAVIPASKYKKLKDTGKVQYESSGVEKPEPKPDTAQVQTDILKEIKVAIGKIEIPKNESQVIVNPDTKAVERLMRIEGLLEKLIEAREPVKSDWKFVIERDKYGRISNIEAQRL